MKFNEVSLKEQGTNESTKMTT